MERKSQQLQYNPRSLLAYCEVGQIVNPGVVSAVRLGIVNLTMTGNLAQGLARRNLTRRGKDRILVQ
jgi:hypothetical protein